MMSLTDVVTQLEVVRAAVDPARQVVAKLEAAAAGQLKLARHIPIVSLPGLMPLGELTVFALSGPAPDAYRTVPRTLLRANWTFPPR